MAWLSERCILAPLNETTRTINNALVAQLPGESVEYKSLDSVLPGCPFFHRIFKLLRVLRISFAFCFTEICSANNHFMVFRSPRVTNGTRCVITQLSANTKEARISHGRYAGHDIIISCIPLIPSNSTLPYEFRCFSVFCSALFAMTINKSQGQTFKIVGVDLTNESLTHGILQVALSKVGSPNFFTPLVREGFKTRNVVYHIKCMHCLSGALCTVL